MSRSLRALLEDLTLKVVETLMRRWYEVTVRVILDDEKNDIDEFVILNRTTRWREGITEYEAEKKLVVEIIKHIVLDAESKDVDGPMAKDSLANLTSKDGLR